MRSASLAGLFALGATAVAGLVLAGVVLAGDGDGDGRAAAAAGDDPSARAFLTVHQVLTSPRCRNCHPAGDAPLQTDEGVRHAQNVSRRSEKNGLQCTACHRAQNGDEPHLPPGVPDWRMPPAETPMVFEGRSPRALCEQLKDPAETRDRDLEALVEHVSSDALVRWGWSPGPGRTLPPVPHDQLVAAMRAWVDGGAVCPP